MSRTIARSSWVFVGLLVPLLAAAGPFSLTSQASSKSAEAADLRPGVVVDPSGGAVYLMNPDGGVDAVSPSTGELLWSTPKAAVPLAIHGDLLIAQGPPAADGKALDVVFVDRRTGDPRRKLAMALPEGVRGFVDEGLGTAFRVRAGVHDDEPFVSWEHTRRYAKGVAPAPGEALEQKQGGAYRLDLQAGRAVAVDPKTLTPDAALPDAVRQWASSGLLSREPAPAGNVLAATQTWYQPDRARILLKRWTRNGEPLPDADLFSGPPYVLDLRSADARHLLVSERLAPGDSEEYGWTVFSLETGRRLGQVRNQRSHAWYVVHESTLVYVAPSHGRRFGGDAVVKPPMLRAVDLATGSSIWERPLRDTSYQGPFPP